MPEVTPPDRADRLLKLNQLIAEASARHPADPEGCLEAVADTLERVRGARLGWYSRHGLRLRIEQAYEAAATEREAHA